MLGRGGSGLASSLLGPTCVFAVLLALAGRTATAQERAPAPRPSNEIDIMEHLGNSHSIELPSWKAPYYVVKQLPRLPPIHLGGVTIDLSPTRHADRKSTRLNSSHLVISYAVFCLKKKKIKHTPSSINDGRVH